MLSTQRKKRSRFSKPRSFKPKPYQEKAIRFGLSRRYAGLFLSPGLGKTAIILQIFKTLREEGLVDEMLVIASKRIVYNVWRQEIKKWGMPFWATVVHGSKKEANLLREGPEVRLLNYEGIPWLTEQTEYLNSDKRIMLVCDESSKLKGSNTQRFKKIKSILDVFDRRYIMTGSPAPQSLMDIWSQLYVLDCGHTLGKFITHFRNRYFRRAGYMGYGWELLPNADKKIFKRISKRVIRFGPEELGLKKPKIINRRVYLPENARRLYNEMERELFIKLQNDEITAVNGADKTGKLRQIANGGIYVVKDGKRVGHKIIHDEKCAELVELLDELQGEPALVAYEFKHDLMRFERYCRRHAKQYAGAPVIDGRSTPKEEKSILARWDKGQLPLLFGQPASMAHGLNMQGKGGIVIYYSLTWNLEYYEQFMQRVWRQGQKRRVLVYRLVADNTVDEDQIATLKMKNRNQQTLLKAMEKRLWDSHHPRRKT